MSDAPWKRIEREVAKRLRGERVPVSGRPGPDVVSVCGGFILAEVKHRRQLPKWLTSALHQAESCLDGDDQLAIAVLHEKYMPVDDCLVVLRLDDFVRWIL